jgi:hypothetical protein
VTADDIDFSPRFAEERRHPIADPYEWALSRTSLETPVRDRDYEEEVLNVWREVRLP